MPENKPDVWLKNAAAIARQFLTLFNGSMLYGCEHPNTAKNAAAFADLINGCFGGRQLITVISHNGAFLIEEWPVDKSFNAGRLLKHFEALKLTSVSFERGVGADSIIQLAGLAGDAHNIEVCKNGIAEAARSGSISRVRINYVLYGKIMADEVVMKGSDAAAANAARGAAISGGGASNISTANLSREAAAQIEQVLTLSALLEKPEAVSAALAQTDTKLLHAEQLRGAFGKIRGEIDSSQTHNIDELLASLNTLKTDLYEAIEVQKTTGKMMRSAAMINKELSDLTAHAIVKLIKEEYKSGKTPLNRLAHTIRRMMPASAELMSILPSMKETLLSEGMSLSEYLELVRALGLKIESESLSDTLKSAAESIGASVSDLVSAIQSTPEEAASLILLASEIRSSADDGASGLPDALTRYIEDICSKMAVDTCRADSRHDSNSLKKVLAQLESQMYSQLSKHGVPAPVLANVKQRLNDNFNETFTAANDNFAETSNARPRAHTANRKKGGGKLKMPSESLNAHNLLFLINKEIKRNLRYKSPFSTITVSMEKIVSPDGTRPLKPEDTAEMLPQLFNCVESMLRDVDLIGTIGAEDTPELFLLLPMTDAEGTAIVKERIIKAAAESTFSAAGETVAAEVKVSITTPNEKTKDLRSYLAAARENHVEGTF
ncbi:MAG: hypothetical protein LBH93_08460 [Chitinispirillales bacterium]|jgi:uncharacterized protein YajQ (UPF0234 family)|nr:hypothetical protein [Chitinispirillales bacterium]